MNKNNYKLSGSGILPVAGGTPEPQNFILSIYLTTFDPVTGEISLLFNPRHQIWAEHFVLRNGRVEGITPTGRATAKLLMFNTPTRVLERQLLIAQNQYP